jgi:S1-C subfamily serine protease
VRGLGVSPLRQADGERGAPVAIAGYPENEGLTMVAGRLGQTANVLSDDAYGRGPVPRRILAFRGRVRHGNSGGPLIDGSGRVVGTVFAARTGSAAGYAVPPRIVNAALADARRPVSTGDCS